MHHAKSEFRWNIIICIKKSISLVPALHRLLEWNSIFSYALLNVKIQRHFGEDLGVKEGQTTRQWWLAFQREVGFLKTLLLSKPLESCQKGISVIIVPLSAFRLKNLSHWYWCCTVLWKETLYSLMRSCVGIWRHFGEDTGSEGGDRRLVDGG